MLNSSPYDLQEEKRRQELELKLEEEQLKRQQEQQRLQQLEEERQRAEAEARERELADEKTRSSSKPITPTSSQAISPTNGIRSPASQRVAVTKGPSSVIKTAPSTSSTIIRRPVADATTSKSSLAAKPKPKAKAGIGNRSDSSGSTARDVKVKTPAEPKKSALAAALTKKPSGKAVNRRHSTPNGKEPARTKRLNSTSESSRCGLFPILTQCLARAPLKPGLWVRLWIRLSPGKLGPHLHPSPRSPRPGDSRKPETHIAHNSLYPNVRAPVQPRP